MKLDNYLLITLMEECAEVTQVASKCLRFGTDSEYNGKTNLERLGEELTDMLAVLDIMKSRSNLQIDVENDLILNEEAINDKKERVLRYYFSYNKPK